jgi:hypothetical protein
MLSETARFSAGVRQISPVASDLSEMTHTPQERGVIRRVLEVQAR